MTVMMGQRQWLLGRHSLTSLISDESLASGWAPQLARPNEHFIDVLSVVVLCVPPEILRHSGRGQSVGRKLVYLTFPSCPV